jgi:predicted AlkP superfamily pyrophosphatase or phosphodiesterase
MQQRGPDAVASKKDLAELDSVCGQLIDHFRSRGARMIILSEYGITAVSKPIHLNRVLREKGLITIREEMGHELLDAGVSKAFAVADHQIAHIYVNDPTRLNEVRQLLEKTPGVERVLDEVGKREFHLNHPRSGELIAIAEPDAWFTYYYWLEESRAPDFAHTVDIHRKPGYDPVELLIDPKLTAPKAKIAMMLLRKKLGFRTLLKVISTDATLIRGSHGRAAASAEEGALLMSDQRGLLNESSIAPTDVQAVMLRHLTD